jgi:hypothetical protein
MESDWERTQGVDVPGAAKFLDGEPLSDCSEYLAIKIKILALQLKIFHALISPFLFAYIVPKAP